MRPACQDRPGCPTGQIRPCRRSSRHGARSGRVRLEDDCVAMSPRTSTTRNEGKTQPAKLNSRAARKLALERQARQRRLTLIGGAVGAAALLALVLVMV